MYAGGIADKLGNIYEAKLLINKVLDVISGELEWVRFEGISAEYKGFEFAVGNKEKTEWFQTKTNSPNGNWTPKALKSEGVLDAFFEKLNKNPSDICYFVSQHTANDLYRLSEKSRISQNAKEFLTSLSKDQTLQYTDLLNDCGKDNKLLFGILRRAYFLTLPEKEIDILIRTKSKILFDKGFDDIFSILRTYMESNLNQVITTEIIRSYLIKKEIPFKNWLLAPTIKEKFSIQTERYLNTYIPFGAGGKRIERNEVNEILKEIEDPKGKKVVLLTGAAGTGKSGVIRELIEQLKLKNINHLAFRVDQHLEAKSPEQIGLDLIERNESPMITLHGVSDRDCSVLIVDQVDAVSEVSGRKGAVRNAILDLLETINILNTKIIFACRDFDLDSDSRLKELEGMDVTKRIKVSYLDWEKQIVPVLAQMGINVSKFSEGQKKLLLSPLNLSIFLEIAEPDIQFNNREDLFSSLIKKKEKSLIGKNLSWGILEPLSHLANWISENQRLNAPTYVFDDFPQAVEILCSEGLIVQEGKNINFFHESFFDYIYARSFINSKQSVYDFLLSTEQHLFRRTQVRQILESLRQHDRQKYLLQIKELFKIYRFRTSFKKVVGKIPYQLASSVGIENYRDSPIRYHIRIAIAMWLGSLKDPVEVEREIGLSFYNLSDDYYPLARAILFGSAGWFDLHLSSNWISKELDNENPNKRNYTLWWLMQIAHDRPQEVSEILRKWWGSEPKKALELIQRSSFITTKGMDKTIEPLERLYCDLIRSQPDGLFPTKSHGSDYILSTWVKNNASRAGNVLKLYFDCWFEMHSGEHPFSNKYISNLDMHSLAQTAKANPSEFVHGFVDVLNRTVDIILENKRTGKFDYTFNSIQESDCHGDDSVIEILRGAFKNLAQSDANLAGSYLSKFHPDKHTIFLHLHLETIAANPTFFSNHLLGLLGNKELFNGGFEGCGWISFARAVKVILPYLESNDQKKVESVIREYTPELDNAYSLIQDRKDDVFNDRKYLLHLLNNSGREQWYILETIGAANLSLEMKIFLSQLGRKFQGETIPVFKGFKGGYVQSPISLEHAKFMSDRQWLQAINKYSDDNNRAYYPDYVVGGAQQLANVLNECTKQDPNRFSKLLIKIPLMANLSYVRSILFGLRESKNGNEEEIGAAIKWADKYPNRPFAEHISFIIGNYPALCRDSEIIQMLMFNAEHIEENEDDPILFDDKIEDLDEEITTIEETFKSTHQLYHIGFTRVRGASAYALSKVYWKNEITSESVEDFLVKRINLETLTSVRCMLVELLLPFYNFDREKCGKFFIQLINCNQDKELSNAIMVSRSGIRLVQHILSGVPNAGDVLVSKLLASHDKNINLIGAWLIFASNNYTDKYNDLYHKLFKRGAEYRRVAAQVAAQSCSTAQYKDKTINKIKTFFADKDEDVRKNATNVFSHIDPDKIDQYHDLIESYIKSVAFSTNTFSFINMLTNSKLNIHEYVIKSAHRIFSNFKKESVNKNYPRRSDIYWDDLLIKQYSASEGNAKLRGQFLDIIDMMLQFEIHGGQNIVSVHDRHN